MNIFFTLDQKKFLAGATFFFGQFKGTLKILGEI